MKTSKKNGAKPHKNKPYQRKALAPSQACFRSSITNGSSLFIGVDERSSYARRFRDVLAAHISDLGGSDNVSEGERSLIRRATTITVALERLENKFAEAGGEACTTDLMTYQRAASALRRLLESTGLKRRCKDVTTLDQYLSMKRQADDADYEEVDAS